METSRSNSAGTDSDLNILHTIPYGVEASITTVRRIGDGEALHQLSSQTEVIECTTPEQMYGIVLNLGNEFFPGVVQTQRKNVMNEAKPTNLQAFFVEVSLKAFRCVGEKGEYITWLYRHNESIECGTREQALKVHGTLAHEILPTFAKEQQKVTTPNRQKQVA